jgi:diketogulonate reductase-like aldo/keto reductase
MKIPNLKLANGNTIPQIGLGLWQVKDQAEFNAAFSTGIEAGYRHFDSAQAYDNEHFLGEAWQASGQKREDLFLTTKIKVQNFGYNKVLSSFDESIEKLQTEYVDLLLLHFPVTVLRKKAWQALEEIQAGGRAKNIGVSNYTIRHLEEMKDYAKVMPVVNQVELHVFLQQPELIKYCHDNDIVVEAYSPLVRGRGMDNKTIVSIAKKHGKSPAQVMLRFLLEQDLVILPKSVTPERIRDNIDIFDFKLDKADKQALAKLDEDMRTNWSPVHVP